MLIERSSKLLNLFNAYLLNCTLIRLYTLLLESVHYFLPGLMVIFIGKSCSVLKAATLLRNVIIYSPTRVFQVSQVKSVSNENQFLNACYLFYCKRFVLKNVSFYSFLTSSCNINQKSIKQQQQQKTWSSGEMSDLCQRISKEMPFPFPLLI